MKMKLKSQSYWRVAMKADVDELFPGRNRMVQGMKDLYPIIEDYIPDEMHDRWMARTSSRLNDLFDLFLAIVKSSLHTPITGYDILYNEGRYLIDIYCYPELNQDYKFYYASFSFLPYLKERDKKLYDMCVEMFRILIVNCHIWTTDSDEADHYFMDNEIENMAYDTEMGKPEKAFIEKEILRYKKHAEKYYKLLSSKRGDPVKLQKMMDKYEIKVVAERKLIRAMELIIKTDAEPGNLDLFDGLAMEKFCTINEIPKDEYGNYEFSDGQPVSPLMAMRAGWFNMEGFTSTQLQWLGDTAGNFGQADYCENYKCSKPGDLEKARIQFTNETGMFLEYLGEFFVHMETHAQAFEDLAYGKLTQILFEDEQSGQSGLSAGKGAESVQAIL